MIAIVNHTEKNDQGFIGTYGKGNQLYSLQINERILGWFTHKFEDGLDVCLKKASEAAKKIGGI